MRELTGFFRFDRKTFYYNSAPMLYRYNRLFAAQKAAADKVAADAKRGTTSPTGATAYTSGSSSTRISSHNNPLNTIGRYGTTKKKVYSSDYHSKSRKKGRKTARGKRRKSLQKRYSKLI